MRIEHILDSEIKARLGVSEVHKGNVHPRSNKSRKRKRKALSERELRELMDSNKRGFKRHRGVWRSK